VATYGAESGMLNKGIAKQLATFERTVLKRMFRGMKVNRNWRKQCNRQFMAAVWRLYILSFVRIS